VPFEFFHQPTQAAIPASPQSMRATLQNFTNHDRIIRLGLIINTKFDNSPGRYPNGFLEQVHPSCLLVYFAFILNSNPDSADRSSAGIGPRKRHCPIPPASPTHYI
jgi:hypothetical protein